jgi:hypothetical protein
VIREIREKATSVGSDVAFVLLIALALSGLGLLAAYLAPRLIGGALGGATILVMGVTFVGVLLIWLSILPADAPGEPSSDQEPGDGESIT